MRNASRPNCSRAPCSSRMLPTDFAIFSSSICTMPLCIQVRDERLAARRLGLRDLVLVVREDEVRSAAVQLERDAEHGLGHRRALDVPAGPAVAPGRLPVGVLALLARLPEREVLGRLLQLGGVVALALLHLLQRAVRELAVAGEGGHAEVHVAAALVGVIRLHERLDQGDDLADRLRGLRLVVRPAEAERRRCPPRRRRSSRARAPRSARRARGRRRRSCRSRR